ncbi:MAG: glycosyltransferase family 25 protein [Sphingobacterium sp.]|jgi:glycosyl transferase family 25|nr:glycosyltransferase family 25 protein [Sphingobacterium sp.]
MGKPELTEMEREQIKTFGINLKHRIDRKRHIVKQFEGRTDFNFELFDAINDQNGSLGLIKSVVSIVRIASKLDLKYVLICEDDHEFTESFSPESLFNQISCADKFGADILLGGISWYDGIVRTDENLYWINQFNGTQFLLIYKRFFPIILNYNFSASDQLDVFISGVSSKIFTSFPFLSRQKYFGYSDATTIHELNQIDSNELFLFTENKIEKIKKIYNFYSKKNSQ